MAMLNNHRVNSENSGTSITFFWKSMSCYTVRIGRPTEVCFSAACGEFLDGKMRISAVNKYQKYEDMYVYTYIYIIIIVIIT